MWRSAAASLEVPVECDGNQHRLIWEAGEVITADHPELDAERALVAFGGAEPPCLNRLKLWEDAVADGGFMAEWFDDAALTPSWLSWLSMALERMRTEGFHEVLRGLHPTRSLRMGEFIEWFPLPWMDRAAADVAESVLDGDGVVCVEAPRHIDGAVAVRLRRAFVNSVGGRQVTIGAAALISLDITVEPSTPASASGSLTGKQRGLKLTVDPRWLYRVWAAGAQIIDGSLTLDLVADGDEGRAVATLVEWDACDGALAARTRTVDVRHSPQGWTLANDGH